MGESSRHLNFQGCTQLKVSSTQYYTPVPSEPAAGLTAEQNVQKNVLETHSADTQAAGDKGRQWMLVFTNVPCAVAKILLLEINILLEIRRGENPRSPNRPSKTRRGAVWGPWIEPSLISY